MKDKEAYNLLVECLRDYVMPILIIGLNDITESDYVTTICPFCQINLQDGLNAIGLENVKTLNLIQLLKMAYDE